jgi:hypothetical protein
MALLPIPCAIITATWRSRAQGPQGPGRGHDHRTGPRPGSAGLPCTPGCTEPLPKDERGAQRLTGPPRGRTCTSSRGPFADDGWSRKPPLTCRFTVGSLRTQTASAGHRADFLRTKIRSGRGQLATPLRREDASTRRRRQHVDGVLPCRPSPGRDYGTGLPHPSRTASSCPIEGASRGHAIGLRPTLAPAGGSQAGPAMGKGAVWTRLCTARPTLCRSQRFAVVQYPC